MPRIQTSYIFRILYSALGGFVAVHVLGTTGYYYLTDGKYPLFDCFYMTFITVSTIGFGEIFDMSNNPHARMFTVFIGILGAGVLSLLFSTVTVALLETDLNGTLRRRRMEKIIKKLRGHYILCGFGRVGRNVAHELEATNRHYVAIDEDLVQLQEYKEKSPGLLYLHGDASDDDVLIRANLEDAKGVFAVTGDDSRNLMIVITVRQLKPDVRIVARCHELRNIEKMRKAGADVVVSPDFTGGMRIASAMIRPHVVSFLDEMLKTDQQLRVEEVSVPVAFTPKPLANLDMKHPDFLLIAVREHNGRWAFNPNGDVLLKPGQTLVAMANPAGRMALEARLIEALG